MSSDETAIDAGEPDTIVHMASQTWQALEALRLRLMSDGRHDLASELEFTSMDGLSYILRHLRETYGDEGERASDA